MDSITSNIFIFKKDYNNNKNKQHPKDTGTFEGC